MKSKKKGRWKDEEGEGLVWAYKLSKLSSNCQHRAQQPLGIERTPRKISEPMLRRRLPGRLLQGVGRISLTVQHRIRQACEPQLERKASRSRCPFPFTGPRLDSLASPFKSGLWEKRSRPFVNWRPRIFP